MKKIELLAPAGSMESLIAAVNNGADAVYLGGIAFGARAYANNFTRDSIIEAINFCHVRGVLVYITMNTLIYESEIEKALNEVEFYYQNNVDALIIQDLGLFTLVRKHFPDLSIHCSTQMHIHNKEAVKFMKRNGASRVVLARETPLNIIKDCVDVGLEIETFVYGALCMSYSGQCMMSSILQHRSGNRGVCAQHCRLQYKLFDKDTNKYVKTDEYLLSPMDLNLINKLLELIKTGITSLKIEGRMKRSEYVGYVVKLFRKAIDLYYEGKDFKLADEEIKNLKLLFNRGFSEGKIFNQIDTMFMNPYRPNHLGIEIGKVISFNKEFVNIKLTEDISQHDGIRILNSNEDHGLIVNKLFYNNKLVNKAYSGQIVSIEKKGRVDVDDVILKTTDYLLNDIISLDNLILKNKVKLNAKVSGTINNPLIIEVDDGIHFVKVTSNILCEKPIKSSVSYENIINQLKKTNDTPYEFTNIITNIENIFIPLKIINELRREAIEKITILRINKYNRNNKKEYKLENIMENNNIYNIFEVNHKDHIGVKSFNNSILFSNSIDMLEYYKEVNYLGNVVNEESINFQTKYVIASQIGDLNTTSDNLFGSYTLNATNSYAVAFLLENGCINVCYSLELNIKQIKESEEAFKARFKFYPNTSTFVYGKRDLMITKQRVVYQNLSNNPLSINLNHSYELENMKKQRLPLMLDNLGYTHILEDKEFILDDCITKSKYFRLTTEKIDNLKNLRRIL